MNSQLGNLQSVGYIAGQLQVPIHQIEQAAKEANFGPMLTLDGVPYFDRVAVEEIAYQLRKVAHEKKQSGRRTGERHR